MADAVTKIAGRKDDVIKGELRVHLIGKAVPAEILRENGEVIGAQQGDGMCVNANELPDGTRVMFAVDMDPAMPHNHVAETPDGQAYFVYCRAGHLSLPPRGLPVA